MTGRTIKSRSSKAMANAVKIRDRALAAAFSLVLAGPAVAATTGPRLPVIQHVGVIPVQWEGGEQDSYGLETARTAIDPAFAAAVHASHRFHVLSDDLVSGLWKDKTGRDELTQNFELQSFASLAVTPRGDTVLFTARLLDPNLKTELLETETVPRSWLVASEADAVKDRVEQLAFRLINRLPIDVSVTSVQGQFLTLSGGAEQGVQVGDQVDLVRTTISSLHPANGSWLDFTKQSLGSAQVIETKGFTAVARIIKLTYDNAVEIGDGAKIPAIAGRVKFARQASGDTFTDAGNQGPIIVPPLYLGTQPKTPAKPAAKPASNVEKPAPASETGKTERAPTIAQSEQEPPPSAPTSEVTDESPPTDPSETAEAKPATAPPATAQSGDSGGLSVWDSFGSTVGSVVDRPFDDIHLYAGPAWWSISGGDWTTSSGKSRTLSAQGKFPVWLINSAGGGITRSLLSPKFHVAFGGGLGFGQTSRGRWTGYDANAMIYYEDKFAQDGEILSQWRAGGIGHLSGWGVTGEYFGGGDWIRGGGFVGLGGRFSVSNAQRYDWFGNFALYPLNFGRIGFDGKRTTIESSFGWQLDAGAYLNQPAGVIQWGGEFTLGTEKESLENNRRAQIGEYTIRALAKYVLP